MNIGKVFEQEFKSSVPNGYWYYRLRDGTAAYGGNEKTRFQATNICDCMVMTNKKLFLIELKNTNGVSLPIGNIKKNQLSGLSVINHSNIEQYFIVCFREKKLCFGIKAQHLNDFIENTERKSIPLQYFLNFGIEIKMTKKKVNYKYDLEEFFNKAQG